MPPNKLYHVNKVLGEQREFENRNSSGRFLGIDDTMTKYRYTGRQRRARIPFRSPIFDFLHHRLSKAKIGTQAIYTRRRPKGIEEFTYEKMELKTGNIVYRQISRVMKPETK